VQTSKRDSAAAVFASVSFLTVLAVVALPSFSGPGPGSGPAANPCCKASVTSPSGLLLNVSVGASQSGGGQSLFVQVTESNIAERALNVSSSDAWAVGGLKMTACYASIYPFGVALYQGNVGAANVSSARQVQIFPLIPCPLLIRYISGYYFPGQGSGAVVLPSPQVDTTTPMSANLTIAGSYGEGAPASTPLLPGTYTLAVGDEWGALAFLRITLA
jgi:hypothetical protein